MGFGGSAAGAGERAARTLAAPWDKPQQGAGLGQRETSGFPETPSLSGPGGSTKSSALSPSGGRGSGPGNPVPKAGPSGVWGGETRGCPGPAHSGSKTSEKKSPAH